MTIKYRQYLILEARNIVLGFAEANIMFNDCLNVSIANHIQSSLPLPLSLRKQVISRTTARLPLPEGTSFQR